MDRRKFIKNSTTQLTGISAFGLASAGIIKDNIKPVAPGNQTNKDQSKIITRVLGKTGIRLPIVSMGVMNANNPNLIKAALDQGIRHLDTAWNYQNGNNEKMVGSVIKESGIKREDIIIADKVLLGRPGDSATKGKEAKKLFLSRFDECLARLQEDYVDILYYHMPSGLEEINDPYILEAFDELKAKKKIRFAGFSIHTYWTDILADAARRKFYDVILLNFNYAMSQDQKAIDALKLAHEAGIGLVAMKTQCQQEWYKRELPAEQQKFYGDVMHTALLKWVLRYEYLTTAIPGFTTYQQLEEDMPVAYNLNYSKEEEEFLKNRNVKLAIRSVCRGCGKCVASCPYNADIPSLMRTHMYSFSYGNPLVAKQTLSMIKPDKGLDICNNCSQCTGKCNFSVPIAERIHELKEVYC